MYNDETLPSARLAIDVDATQKSILKPSMKDFLQKSIINCASGDGARLKLSKRKLISLSYLVGESGVQNDPKRLQRMKNQLDLTASIEEKKNTERS